MDVLHHTDSYSHFHSKNKLDENMFGLVHSWVTLYIRDWSLITGRGGYKTGAGGHLKFFPNVMGGGWAEKVLAMLKGGAQTIWW